ncbi:hypothetical protein K493DRAFT_319211 [Basidiobolus meristosporus CBS 931.73]|uniref:DUF3421 domain-containing protein n=1 Tax=Basidiobolus meristosporus CBS 931.73 TaxID=1314790 RepID=A0A1Y1XSQ5_9FUNG|nr:hypothetical protein K493DRAFT_319211 [Basidiobolus meristosporus CBS 931.73]|eukprot:ORX88770.1 hypothetical protein K493DRAFT_319211 [Basidiobolus meristosporus CBS 931.73]
MLKVARSLPEFEWVYASGGSIPPNAVQGGYESDGRPLFIARYFHKDGLHIGKAAPHLKGINFGYDGKEHCKKEYYVLCGPASKLHWVQCEGPVNPTNWVPLEAGREADGKELFIAKIKYEGGEHIGKAGEHLLGICFPYGGKERIEASYYVLAIQPPQ